MRSLDFTAQHSILPCMLHRTEQIESLQTRLRQMNADGWITYGQVERAAGVYRSWCNNFIAGCPDRMTMSGNDIDKVGDVLREIHTDIEAIA